METPRPGEFISHQEQERIDFYKQWVYDALTIGLAGLDDLISLRDRFELDRDDMALLRHRDIDQTVLQAAYRQIQTEIETEVADAARDLQANVFESGLFRVGIVIDDQVWPVNGIAAAGETVVPLIDGQAYDGGIDEVIFSR
ncbi:MAG TPA: hypothetical protein VFK03_00755 [Candidatus Saccharimonadales bacterium]|nr:hypothetical protein [Candidatus Saccharimonadales bacterium]